ncbi:hypothetical protein V8C35DRAFT_328183 [Trichoderma chlorosporum]
MSSQDRVPYVDGLTEGQGYNTFLQNGCMHGAASITKKADAANPLPPVEVTYEPDLITDYEKLVSSLDISAGAGISKLEIGGEIDAKFLDRTEIETSFMTYLVKVDVRQQPSTTSEYTFNWTSPGKPQEIYGDRFISDFVKGGALFARVSIITKDTSVTDVSADPEKAKTKPPFDYPKVSLKEVLLAVQSTRFIAQSLHLPSGKRTHFIDGHLHPESKKLFEIEAYSFGDVTGITNVIFAKLASEETFICLIGSSLLPGYEEMSRLWVSENQVDGIFDQQINVYSGDGAGYVELELQEADTRKDSDPLFSFFGRTAN